MIGGMGRPAGGITGGGGKGMMAGRLTSSTMRGSLPWSNGQRSPRTQNPFSVGETKRYIRSCGRLKKYKNDQSSLNSKSFSVSISKIVLHEFATRQSNATRLREGVKER